MPESLALQGFLAFLLFGTVSLEIYKPDKIEAQNAQTARFAPLLTRS